MRRKTNIDLPNREKRPFLIQILPYITLLFGIAPLIDEWRLIAATFTPAEPHISLFTAGIILPAVILVRRWGPPALARQLALVILFLSWVVILAALHIVTNPAELRLATFPHTWLHPYPYFLIFAVVLSCGVSTRIIRRAISEYRTYHTFGLEHRLLV